MPLRVDGADGEVEEWIGAQENQGRSAVAAGEGRLAAGVRAMKFSKCSLGMK